MLGSRREESLRARSGFAARRRAPTAVVGRSQARRRAGGTVLCRRRSEVFTSLSGLPVTQRRPWPAEALGARHALRPACCTGRRKTGGAIPRGESRPCDPRRSDNHRRICAPGMCRTHASVLDAGASAARVRAQPVFRLAEGGLGRTRPALRRQPHSRSTEILPVANVSRIDRVQRVRINAAAQVPQLSDPPAVRTRASRHRP